MLGLESGFWRGSGSMTLAGRWGRVGGEGMTRVFGLLWEYCGFSYCRRKSGNSDSWGQCIL
jgi:hypothetical protein